MATFHRHKFRRASDMNFELAFVVASSKPTIRSVPILYTYKPLNFLPFLNLMLGFSLSSCNKTQFRESGCENCPFFKMDEDHERVVDCTTPNFNGFVGLPFFTFPFCLFFRVLLVLLTLTGIQYHKSG